MPLAERGCRITAVELGAAMAAVASHNPAGYETVEVLTAEFETWPLPAEPFDTVVFRRYEWDRRTPSRNTWIYSGHRALPPETRERLLECIASLIDRLYGGRIVKRYLAEPRVSRTRASPW